jgi:hypothetical protein
LRYIVMAEFSEDDHASAYVPYRTRVLYDVN